jgi:hypothetical protein
MRGYLAAVVAEDRGVARALYLWAALQLLIALWDLPGAYGWENDGIAPRDVFGGLAINLTPGQGHRYPLFHYLLVTLVAWPAWLFGLLAAGDFSPRAIEQRILQPDVMTATSLAAKAIAVAMGIVALLVLARIVRRTWSAEAGRWAAFFAATSTTLAYYTRTSNLDGPAMMWALLAIDRGLDVLRGGGRRDLVLLSVLMAAAVATKDQAYGWFALSVPLYAWVARGRVGAGALRPALASGAAAYAVLSGAVFNPTGFLTRVRLLSGTNSQDWRQYERGVGGIMHNLRDIAAHQAEFFWPWPVVALAWAGVVLALRARERRAQRALLLAAALSSIATFTLVVARCEHRFVLPLAAALAGYAGIGAAELLTALRSRVGPRWAALALAAFALAPVGRYAALAATQWGDARRDVEALLSRLPHGSKVEVYGPMVYWPRFDLDPSAPYRVTHVDQRRMRVPGLEHAGLPYAGAAERSADVLIVPEPFATRFVPAAGDERPVSTFALESRAAGDGVAYFGAALAGHVPGYRQALVAEPRLPEWMRAIGLEPVAMQGSTAQRTRVFERCHPGECR